MRFTNSTIQGLKPRGARYEVLEDNRNGFGIRVTPQGSKSFFSSFRRAGKLRRVTHGTYPALSLVEAHALHARLRKDLASGKLGLASSITVKELAAQYIEKYAKVQKRSWQEDVRVLEKDVLPRWGNRQASKVSRRDIIALVDDVVARGSPIMANRTLATVRKMFNWAISRDLITENPAFRVVGPGREARRDRVLSDAEIRTFWSSNSNLQEPMHAALRLILITGQRKGEILAATRSEFDVANRWWTIPGTHAKNKLAHRVPLSDLAMATLADIDRISGWSDYLFPSPTGDGSVRPPSLDRTVRRHRKEFDMDHWTPHDLRRTAASRIASLGHGLLVGKILNHAERGVTAIYDRHSYDAEKRRALDDWGNALQQILELVGVPELQSDRREKIATADPARVIGGVSGGPGTQAYPASSQTLGS